MAKERTEWMDQRQRVAGFFWTICTDHAESVSVAHLHFGCDYQGYETAFGGTL